MQQYSVAHSFTPDYLHSSKAVPIFDLAREQMVRQLGAVLPYNQRKLDDPGHSGETLVLEITAGTPDDYRAAIDAAYRAGFKAMERCCGRRWLFPATYKSVTASIDAAIQKGVPELVLTYRSVDDLSSQELRALMGKHG